MENYFKEPEYSHAYAQLFLYELCFLSFLQLVFFYLVEVRKVGQQEAGFLTSAQWIAGAAGATLGGFLCDRFAKKIGPRWGYRILSIPSLLLAAVFLLIGALSSNPYLSVGFLSLSFGCTQLTEGSYWAAIASVSGRHACIASGMLNTGGNAVGGIGALLVPITAKLFGWVVAVSTGCVFALIAALLWFLIRADVPMVSQNKDVIHP